MLKFEFDQAQAGKYSYSPAELLNKDKFQLDFDCGLGIDIVNRQKYEKREQGEASVLNFADEFLLSEFNSVVEFNESVEKKKEKKSKPFYLT